MVDVIASKNPKGTNTKEDKEDMMPKTTFFSKVNQISDINIYTVNMIQLKDILKEGQSPMAKIYKTRIVHAVAFPPTLPCPKFVMERASQFDIISRSIIFDEGKRVWANIDRQVVEGAFNIPQYKSMTVIMMDQMAKLFQDNQETYFIHLKKNWLHEGNKGVTKSSKLTRSDFKPEYDNLIMLLSRIMGFAQGMQFKN